MTKKERKVIPASKKESKLITDLKLIAGESEASDIPSMSKKLKPIQYIPTIFTSFNRAIVLGGAPIRSTYIIHGPPSSGKSAFALGLINSFTKRGHAAAYIDAEHAVSKKWFNELGADMNSILFEQPDTFEEAIALVDKWILNFKNSKQKGLLSENKSFIIVVDTIHKLIPTEEMKQLISTDTNITNTKATKKINDNIMKGWGRYRANMITSWLDKLTPVIGKNNIAFIALAHEKDKQRSSQWVIEDYKVKGGQSLIYDSLVRVRITKGSLITNVIDSKKIITGMTCNGVVLKNKVGYPNENFNIYISNGKGNSPIGFDLEREILMEGIKRGVITRSGAWLYMHDDTKHHGDEATIEYLQDNAEAYESLYNKLMIESVYQCV